MMKESKDAQPGGLACGASTDAASTITQGTRWGPASDTNELQGF